jgi:hypothetical protein
MELWLKDQYSNGKANQKEIELALLLEGEKALLIIRETIIKNIDRDRNLREALSNNKPKKYVDTLKIETSICANVLDDFYSELNPDLIYEIMPLLFSPDMKTQKSVYLKDANTRKAAFLSFEALIKKDGIDLITLKEFYKINSKHTEYLPLHEKIGGIYTTKETHKINIENNNPLSMQREYTGRGAQPSDGDKTNMFGGWDTKAFEAPYHTPGVILLIIFLIFAIWTIID